MFKIKLPQSVHLFFWRGIQGAGQQFLQFIFSILLARLLCPEVFGEIGMLMIFIYISKTLIDSGFSVALVQREKVEPIHYTSVMILNFIISIILYLLIFILAPYIGNFYDKPHLSLIIKVLAIKIIITAFSISPHSKMRREFKQKALALINITSLFIGYLVGIIMALLSFGVWSLVFQQLSACLILTVLYILSEPTLLRFKIKLNALKDMYKFSVMLLFNGILARIFDNIYSIVLGKFYTADSVGFLNRAKSLNDLTAKNFMNILGESQTPILYRFQDENAKLRDSISRLIQLSIYFIYPIITILFVFSNQIILILLGTQWLPAAPYLKILCLSSLFLPLAYFNDAIYKVKGRSDYLFKITFIKNILIAVSIVCLIKYGIEVLLLGQVACFAITFCFYCRVSSKLIDYGFIMQLKDILPFFLMILILGLILSYTKIYIRNFDGFLQILIITLECIIIYPILSVIFKFSVFLDICNLLTTKLNFKKSYL